MGVKQVITIRDSKGKERKVNLLTYLVSEDSLRNYIVYHIDEVSGPSNDHVIYVSKLADNHGMIKLEEIVDDSEWVDVQNVKYLKREPDKRRSYLATLTEKILFNNSGYNELEEAVFEFAREDGVPYYEIELTGMQYPDKIEW